MRDRESYSPLGSLLLPLAVVALPAIVFWNAFSLRGVFYYGDVVGQFYPLKVALNRALAAGQLPLWTTELMAGYPLLGEGEGGFLYPFSLLFSLFLPPTAALNYQVLFHLALAGVGGYAFCRVLRCDPLSSAVGGALYMLSGFLIAHLNHLSILSAAAWLPFQFAFVELMLTRRRLGVYAALLALAIAVQFLAGHAQISFLSLFGLSVYVIFRAATEFVDGQGLGRPLALLAGYALAVVVGLALAGPQLLTTLELTELSVRAGGLSGDFFTSFSLPPHYVLTFLLPFVTGNPFGTTSPATAVEWCGYTGILTLLLAGYAVLFRRDRYTLFFLLLVVLSLALALGQWNPLYERLAAVPGFNLFRVPARYLYLYSFAMAALGALGLQRLIRPGLPLVRALPGVITVAVAIALLAIGAIIVVASTDLERLIAVWQVLPWALLAVGLALVVVRGRLLLGTRSFAFLAVLLLAVDLYAFAAVFGATFNATAPAELITQRPAIAEILKDEREPYRVYTHERIVPVAEGVREALTANYALVPGLPSLNGYLPLTLHAYREFAAQLPTSARLANLANVKYLLIPQLVADDEATERENLANPLSPSPVGRKITFAPAPAAAIEVESSLSHAANLPNGSVVAEVVVTDGVSTQVFPLRAGIETAEWAYDRPDVRPQMKHARPQVARSWPARSAYPPQAHYGNTYLARLTLSRPTGLTAVEIVPRHPQGYVHVERVVLIDPTGKRTPLANLAGYGDFETAYRGNEVVAYRNRDALPRFTIVHKARRAGGEAEAWQMLAAADFDPAKEVVLGPPERTGTVARLLALNPLGRVSYEPLAEGAPVQADGLELAAYGSRSLSLKVSMSTPGYLVVADTFYPGWRAQVDGRAAPILRANWLFRAVELPAGEHVVEMRYEPASWSVGWALTAFALMGLGALAVAYPRGPEIGVSSWRTA